MKENELSGMANGITCMLEELDEINEMLIREWCDERHLDPEVASNYAKAAGSECEYLRPTTSCERELIEKYTYVVSPNSDDEACISCFSTGSGNIEKELEEDEESLYGWWKQIERAVKRGRKSLQRRGRNVFDKVRWRLDNDGGITARNEVPFERIRKERKRGMSRMGKELTKGVIINLTKNLRRVWENYDRCVEQTKADSERPDERYRRRMRRCDEVAASKTRRLFKPFLDILDGVIKNDLAKGSVAIREAIKDITERRRFKKMQRRIKVLAKTMDRNKVFSDYAKYFEWFKDQNVKY